jgi:hypothetical protein
MNLDPLMLSHLAWLSFATLLLMSVCGCDHHQDGAHLSIDTPQIDLGPIPPEGRKLQIPIRNVGDRPLAISGVAKNCNCAKVDSPKELAAGETGQITVAIPPTIGNRTLRLMVNSNSRSGTQEVLIAWHGDTPPNFDPPRLILRDREPGSTTLESVRLAYGGGESQDEPVINDIVPSSHTIVVRRGESTSASKGSSRPPANRREILGSVQFMISCTAPKKPGVYHEQCVFHLSSAAGEMNLALPIEIHVKGSLASQGSIVFSGADVDQLLKARRTVKVHLNGNIDAVPSIHAPDLVKCSIARASERTPNGMTYEVTATLTRAPSQDTYRSEIRVSNAMGEVSIPLLVMAPTK